MDQEDETQTRRNEMVTTQIVDRGIRDREVVRAMRTVPREKFVVPASAASAYDDCPLPIGWGQTISQPYIVAYMIEALALKRGETVLEVGAGSGYAAAILAEICGHDHVYGIERLEQLADQANANLAAAGYGTVQIRHGDGTEGWPEAAPFDAILVSAGAPHVPHTLAEQLRVGGRMIVPVGGSRHNQALVLVTRKDQDSFDEQVLGDVRFVPLIGSEGWHGRRGFFSLEELVFSNS